jgi:predicted acyltransferase
MPIYTTAMNTPDSESSAPATEAEKRLHSLDVFRGLTVAAMIIVNTPGSWNAVYPALRHAPWHGCNPADFIFPFFLFIAGASMAFARRRGLSAGSIIRRTALLCGMCLLLNLFPHLLDWCDTGTFSLSELRITGVLQRIGLAGGIAGLMVTTMRTQRVIITAAGLLIGYWILLSALPFPESGTDRLTPEGNIAGFIDRALLTPNHMYRSGPTDPEGLLSTLPAAVTVICGFFCGTWLTGRTKNTASSIRLAAAGLALAAAGRLWAVWFPLNKPLWTSSYVLYTAGAALLLLALFFEIIEVRGCYRAARPFTVLGRNAISAYVASAVFVRLLLHITIGQTGNTANLYSLIYTRGFVPWAGALNGSLAFACAHLLLWMSILWVLYRRNIFIRI